MGCHSSKDVADPTRECGGSNQHAYDATNALENPFSFEIFLLYLISIYNSDEKEKAFNKLIIVLDFNLTRTERRSLFALFGKLWIKMCGSCRDELKLYAPGDEAKLADIERRKKGRDDKLAKIQRRKKGRDENITLLSANLYNQLRKLKGLDQNGLIGVVMLKPRE